MPLVKSKINVVSPSGLPPWRLGPGQPPSLVHPLVAYVSSKLESSRGVGNSVRLLSVNPTPSSSFNHIPSFSPKRTWKRVRFHHRLCERWSHLSLLSARFSGCHALPKPFFLGFGSPHHGNHSGSSHSIPRWSLTLPTWCTLKNAVWLLGLLFKF